MQSGTIHEKRPSILTDWSAGDPLTTLFPQSRDCRTGYNLTSVFNDAPLQLPADGWVIDDPLLRHAQRGDASHVWLDLQHRFALKILDSLKAVLTATHLKVSKTH